MAKSGASKSTTCRWGVMKLRSLVSALALCAAVPAMAAPTCTDTFSLGALGMNQGAGQWRPFFSAQSFNDCFEFTLLQSSDTSVLSASVDLSFRLNIYLAC